MMMIGGGGGGGGGGNHLTADLSDSHDNLSIQLMQLDRPVVDLSASKYHTPSQLNTMKLV